MEFFETIRTRRSVRKFTPNAVPAEVVHRAIDAALLAPNSSNMQPWEFYWVRNPEKKKLLAEYAMSQSAAKTAAEIVVVVSRVDTWRRNRSLMLDWLDTQPAVPKMARDYYGKLIPMVYTIGPLGIFGRLRAIAMYVAGFFRPVPRGPNSRSALFEVVTKTTALACENLMLAIVAQGYGCCPMEGFDERRVKKLLGLNRHSHVVMMIGIGEPDERGIYGPQKRFDRSYFVHEV